MSINVQKYFDENFPIFLKDLKTELKSNIFDKNIKNKSLSTQALKYIAALNDLEQLQVVEEHAKNYPAMRIHRISNSFMDAIYIDSDYNYNALFVVVKEEYKSLDPEKLNYGSDSFISNEIKKTISAKNLTSLTGYGFDTTVNILSAIYQSIAYHNNVSMDELDYIRMVNTQKEFIKYYNLYRIDEERIRSYDFDFINYDHLKFFSLNYYAMIKVMSDVYKKEGRGKGFTIHDAGTSNFQFALMLATLSEDELMQLMVNEVIASDLDLGFKDKTERYINEHKVSKPMRYVQQDFMDESIELPEADVTVINDVLEHMPTDQAAFRVMERFWERTRKLLIIHVPLEEEPAPEWGHYISFNTERLNEWAGRLSGHVSLADEYYFSESQKYSYIGYLILKRVS